jgi:hypothetical protein
MQLSQVRWHERLDKKDVKNHLLLFFIFFIIEEVINLAFFNARQRIEHALKRAINECWLPMRFDTMKANYPDMYKEIFGNGNNNGIVSPTPSNKRIQLS